MHLMEFYWQQYRYGNYYLYIESTALDVQLVQPFINQEHFYIRMHIQLPLKLVHCIYTHTAYMLMRDAEGRKKEKNQGHINNKARHVCRITSHYEMRTPLLLQMEYFQARIGL